MTLGDRPSYKARLITVAKKSKLAGGRCRVVAGARTEGVVAMELQ